MYLPFRTRLVLSLGILVVLVVGLGFSALSTFQAIQRSYSPLEPEVIPAIVFLLETKSDLFALKAALERTIANGDNTYVVRAQQLVPNIQKAAANHTLYETLLSEEGVGDADEIEEKISRIITLFNQINEIAKENSDDPTRLAKLDTLQAESDLILNQLFDLLNVHTNLHITEINRASTEVNGLIQQATRNMLIGTILTLLIAFGIVFMVIKMIMKPVLELEKGAGQFASGNLNYRIHAPDNRDIFSRLAHSFNMMADTIIQRESSLKMTNLNLEKIVVERTKHAEQALIEAEIANKALEKQIGITTALARLSEKMRGDIGLFSLAANIVQEICEQIDAQVGVIYFSDYQDPVPTFSIGASYAYSPGSDRPTQFKSGEGLIGQVAIDRNYIYLDHQEIQDIRIVTGMGHVIPLSTVIAPIIFNNTVIAIFEAASVHSFSPSIKEYLPQALENAAIGFHTAQVRGQIDDLLVKTAQQAARFSKND